MSALLFLLPAHECNQFQVTKEKRGMALRLFFVLDLYLVKRTNKQSANTDLILMI